MVGRQHEDPNEYDAGTPRRPMLPETHPAARRRPPRGAEKTESTRLSIGNLSELQRLIGNQSTARFLQWSGRPTVVQRWPTPEVRDQPEASTFSVFKCHDAVVYWVARSLDLSTSDATEALQLVQKKRGSSMSWIVEALGYDRGTRLKRPGDAQVGDILYTGHTSYVAHTMVVLDPDHIVGFNNFGTFGTKGGGDLYSQEEFSAARFWHDVEGQRQIGTGVDASFPIYRVPIETAQGSLREFIQKVKTEPDFQIPQVAKKKKGCYITTAVTMTKGLPDDCEELNVLRDFRDGFILERPGGADLVNLYYRYAPMILDEIAKRSDAGSVYGWLYEVIAACVQSIKAGHNDFAYRTYCDMVVRLKDEYIPNVELPAYRI
jgi:hypothetical protein